MSTNKRIVPTDSIKIFRRAYLLNLKELKLIKPDNISYITLSEGNRKTGTSGKFFNSVFVWNLPSVATCPGRSDWCMEHCYNADTREDLT